MAYEWIDLGNGRSVCRRVDDGPPPARSHLPCPAVIGDSTEPVQSQLDGLFYDSKSALRKTYKDAGVTEVGNDAARLKPRERPKPDKQAIRTSIQKAKSQFNNGKRAKRSRK